MAELSIRIKIANREYPMRVKAEEEERLRTAAKMINEKLKSYGNDYGIDDKQDLLAMVAFDFLVEKLKSEHINVLEKQELSSNIDEIDQMISQAISR